MIYEVWIKGGIDLDYFGTPEAAEMWIENYITKRNVRKPLPLKPWTREDFEIREKEEPVNNHGVIIPGCDWPS